MYGRTWYRNQCDIEAAFKHIADDILKNGLKSKPRGKETSQCIGATVIMDPKDTMIRNKKRKMNYVFSLVQKIVYTSGQGLYNGILDWYNSNYSYYEDGMDIGNYGWRITPQLRHVVQTLQKDRDSRQAVITIYNNLYDQRQTLDTPCTLSLHFLIRNDKLDLIASMRSNDLLWGFSYDINQFAYIQKLLAMILGVEPGQYIHHSNSLHIYDYSYEAFRDIIKCDEYVLSNEQPDLVPRYQGKPQQRLTSYLRDCDKFWKSQSMSRFASQMIYVPKFEDLDGFFDWRIQKVQGYNDKKIRASEQSLVKYLNRQSFKAQKRYS